MQDADCETAFLTRDGKTSAGGEDKASEAIALGGVIQTGHCTPDVLSAKSAEFVIYMCSILPSFLSAKAAGHLSAIFF